MDTVRGRAWFARPGRRLALVIAVAAAAVLGISAPAFATTTPTLYGPDSITSSGNYTYQAQYFAPYAWFQWYVRTCDTTSVDTCTSTWVQQWGSVVDDWTQTLTEHLTYTCPSGALAATRSAGLLRPVDQHSSYQVKVVAGAFGQPAQTVYKVTDLCGAGPL